MPVPIELFWPFLIVTVLITLAPGPDNLFLLTLAARHGAKIGLYFTLGIVSGEVVHTLAVLLGLSVLLQLPPVFLAWQAFGAVYLLYLSWQLWQAKPQLSCQGAAIPPMSFRKAYQRGLLMNLSNPKVLLFFLSFLPQFVDNAGAVGRQLAFLALTAIVITFLIFSSIALVASQLRPWLGQRPQLLSLLERATALVLALLSLFLVFSSVKFFL
jgi:threonine/homoserine/homoserine lactone efflux protein